MTKESSVKNSQLGDLVARSRKAQGLTLRDVSQESGIDIHTISMLERGRYEQPNPRTLKGVARALDIPLFDIYDAANYLTRSDVLAMAEQVATVPVFTAAQVAANELNLNNLIADMEDMSPSPRAQSDLAEDLP